MAPRCLSTLLLLLLVAALQLHRVDVSFVLTSLPVEKVPVARQLNASQAFVKVWQIRVNASENVTAIGVIVAALPCQTFITYADGSASSSSSGGALGEVRVSGSTELIVEAVRVTSVTYSFGPEVLLHTYKQSAKEEFLLVEVVLFAKNKLKIIDNQYLEDVVVLEDVLYSKANAESQTTDSNGRLSSDHALILEEDTKIVPSNEASYPTRSWQVKWPSSGRPTRTQNVSVKLLVPGSLSLSAVDRYLVNINDSQAGVISVIGTNSTSSSIDLVEVVSSTGANSSQEIQVRFKDNATGNPQAFLKVEAWFVQPLRVNDTYFNIDPAPDRSYVTYSDLVVVTAGYGGNIFISDKNLQVNATCATFCTNSYGAIQVELKDIVANDDVSFESWSNGNITYIGAHSSSLRASLPSNGFLCFPSSAASVTVDPPEHSDQVVILGQQDARFSCVVKPVPERRMTRLEPNKWPTDYSADIIQAPVEDDKKGSGTVTALTVIGILVGSVAVIAFIVYVLKKAGYFERCRSRRAEVAVAVPVGNYSRQ